MKLYPERQEPMSIDDDVLQAVENTLDAVAEDHKDHDCGTSDLALGISAGVKLKREHWLSFCSDDDKFLGACMVIASDTVEAVKIAHEKKINPGGEVMAVAIPVTIAELAHASPFLHRLLTAEEAIAFDAHMSGGEGRIVRSEDFPVCPGCGKSHVGEIVCTHGNTELQ